MRCSLIAPEAIRPLSPREKEVLDLIVIGETNKQIARRLGISYRTVEIHRAAIMRNLGAKNVVQLVRMMLIAG